MNKKLIVMEKGTLCLTAVTEVQNRINWGTGYIQKTYTWEFRFKNHCKTQAGKIKSPHLDKLEWYSRTPKQTNKKDRFLKQSEREDILLERYDN